MTSALYEGKRHRHTQGEVSHVVREAETEVMPAQAKEPKDCRQKSEGRRGKEGFLP